MDGSDGYVNFEENERLSSEALNWGDGLKNEMWFAQKADVIYAVKNYSIKRCPFHVKESTPGLWHVHCTAWETEEIVSGVLMQCAKARISDSLSQRRYDHIHASILYYPRSSIVGFELVKSRFLNHVRARPYVKIAVLHRIVLDMYDYDVRIRAAKDTTVEIVYADQDSSYNQLPTLMHNITSVDSIAKFKFDLVDHEIERHKFWWLFWTFGPCGRAFKYCRPVVSIDDTFSSPSMVINCRLLDWRWFLKLLKNYSVVAVGKHFV